MKLEGLMFILCPKNWSNSQFSCHRMNVGGLTFILCPKAPKKRSAMGAGDARGAGGADWFRSEATQGV